VRKSGGRCTVACFVVRRPGRASKGYVTRL
jgi:hypothetical protein